MQLFNRLGEMMEGNAKKIIEPAWDVIQKDKPTIRLPELFKDALLQKADGHIIHGI